MFVNDMRGGHHALCEVYPQMSKFDWSLAIEANEDNELSAQVLNPCHEAYVTPA